MGLTLIAAVLAGCDAGPETDESKGVGPLIHRVDANVSGSKMLPANGTIELAFDRLLLPASITRQTFIMSVTPPPVPSYDPVTRIVTLTPLAPLVPGQTYTIQIASPQSATDLNGLRAIDGATLDPNDAQISFMVSAPTPQTNAGPLDFCGRIQPILGTCNGAGCHGGVLPAAGLELSTGAFVQATAIGRVAHGANNGPSALPQAPGLRFGEDMPIIDPGTGGAGDPGNSWMIYKLLLAHVAPGSPMAGPFAVQWQPLSDSERTVLGSFVPGLPMPYPGDLTDAGSGLSTQDMDTLSLWIAEGATVSAACGQ